MSSISKKGRIYYYYRRVHHKDGHTERVQKSLRTRDEDEAEELKEKWDYYYDRIEENPDYEPATIRDKIKEYTEYQKRKVDNGTRSPNSLRTDKLAVKRFKRYLINKLGQPNIYCNEVKREHIEGFQEWRLKKVKQNTVTTNLRHLQSFFTWLYNRQEIENHPFDNFTIPQTISRSVYPSKQRWKTVREEIRKRVKGEKEGDPFFVMMWLLCNTGMRLGEALILKWERGSDDKGEGHSRSYGFIEQQEAVIHFKRNLRRVPLFQVWNDIQKIPRDDKIYVFESPDKAGNPVLTTTWSRRTSKFLTNIGFPDWTAHVLRHAYVTQKVRENHPPATIAQLVGHRSEKILDIYTHVNTDDIRGIM